MRYAFKLCLQLLRNNINALTAKRIKNGHPVKNLSCEKNAQGYGNKNTCNPPTTAISTNVLILSSSSVVLVSIAKPTKPLMLELRIRNLSWHSVAPQHKFSYPLSCNLQHFR